MKVLASVIAFLALALAAYRTVLIAVADWHFREGDIAGIESAERTVPSSARYHFARALAVQQADPTSAEVDRELARSVALNPRFSDAMLSWSVDKEFNGDKKGAEELLLEANSIDRLLRPSWALANFYYRQGNATRFWPQARECLRLIGVFGFTTGRYDPNPVFRLCWSMDSDAAAILSKAIPDSAQIEEIYLSFLMNVGKIDAQPAVAQRLLPIATPAQVPPLLAHINVMIDAGQIAIAVREWNALIDRKLLTYAPLDPLKGASLTDGSFQGAPEGAGFDWRPLYPESIHFGFVEPEHTYQFDFDGTEPQQVDLLSQTAPLLSSRTYQFHYRYHAAFDATKSGLNWGISVNHTPLPTRVVSESGTDDKTVVVEFQTPAETKAGTMKLSYSRQPGTTLLKDSFDLLQTSLKLL